MNVRFYMNRQYETSRLLLNIGDPALVDSVFAYLSKNSEDFDKWDLFSHDEPLTREAVKKELSSERRLFNKGEAVRYYISLKDNPSQIIGNISFININSCEAGTCRIGYKTDADFRLQGYCYEAITWLLPLIIEEFGLKRIDADIAPANTASKSLIHKLGFHFVCSVPLSCEKTATVESCQRYSFRVPLSSYK